MARKKMNEKDKKSKITIKINEVLNERLDDFLKEKREKKSRLIEKLLKDYINKN